MDMELLNVILIALVAIAVIIFFYYVPFMLWINAVVSGVHVSLVQLFLMRIRKVPPTTIVNCLIEDTHSTFNMDLMRGMEYGICLISLQRYYIFSIMQVVCLSAYWGITINFATHCCLGYMVRGFT